MAYKLTATEDSKVFEFKAEGRKFTLTQETQKVAHIQAASKAAKGLRVCTVNIVTEAGKPVSIVMCDFPCTSEEALNAARAKIDGFRVVPFEDIEQAMMFAVCMLKG